MKSKLKLLDKCECMTLLCTRASTHWSFIKFCFNIPLVLTSSCMCIINSISDDANSVKVPNIVVNAVSVLIMSITNSVKPSEKFDVFKRLSQQFMELSQEIDSIEEDNITKEQYDMFVLKYENLLRDLPFEEIPQTYKSSVAQAYQNAGRNIPIQLNGTMGNIVKKRDSKGIGTFSHSEGIEMISEIV